MKERETPETDALVEKWDYSPIPKVMEAHARNLERQRDEARADAQSAKDTATEYGMKLDDTLHQRNELLAALEAYRGQVANDGKSGYAEAAIAAVKGGKP